jgi:hypothetical protein
LHADTPTRMLSVSAHEPQTFPANLLKPKNFKSNKHLKKDDKNRGVSYNKCEDISLGIYMSEKNNFLYDVSMSYVNAGWQERYCALVKYLDAYLKENCGEFFADLQLYQTGPMNYVVVAVYYDVPGVGEALPKILGFVNAKYREVVGHNVRRKQILKFDLAKKLHGQSEVCLHASSEEMEESEDEQPREDYASSTGEEIRQERNDTTS